MVGRTFCMGLGVVAFFVVGSVCSWLEDILRLCYYAVVA